MSFDLKGLFLVMMCINIMLFLGQMSVTKINPESAVIFYNYEGSILKDYDSGGYTLNESLEGEFPTSSNSVVSTDDGNNFFTDTFSAIKEWLLDSTGIQYALNVLNAVPNFLKAMSLPVEFVFAIAVLWHTIGIISLIGFIRSG